MRTTKTVFGVVAGIVLAAGLTACSPGGEAEDPTPTVTSAETATASALPMTEQSSGPKASAEEVCSKALSTVDSAVVTLGCPAGTKVASTDIADALRAGLKAWRFEDGSAVIVDPDAPVPTSVVKAVKTSQTKATKGVKAKSENMGRIIGGLHSSGLSAFYLNPILTDETHTGWAVVSGGSVEGNPIGPNASTVDGAVAAAKDILDAHPDVPLIGPDGVIKR